MKSKFPSFPVLVTYICQWWKTDCEQYQPYSKLSPYKLPRFLSSTCLLWSMEVNNVYFSYQLLIPTTYDLFSDYPQYCRYLFCCSYTHNVAAKGKYIAFVSTEAETDQPEVELKPGTDLLGPVDEIFYDTYERFEPTNDHQVDGCYISEVSRISPKHIFFSFFHLLSVKRY